MKHILSHIILFFIAILVVVGLCSCEDRLDYPTGVYEEGISTVDVDLTFKTLTPVLDGSRSTGDATKYIDQLWFVIYDANQNYLEKRHITPDSLTVTVNKRPDGAPSSEEQTGHAVVKLTLANGNYYIYAVANHDLTNADVTTIEKLKALPLKWNETYSDDAGWHSPNSQMLGGFKPMAKKDNKDSEAEKITINGASTKIHAWLTRAVSKVTVAFDTRNLNDDVELYIKSVAIKDAPLYCPLGYDNAPGQDNMESYQYNDLTKAERDKLIDGEVFYFASAKEKDEPIADHGKWRRIASGDSIYGLYTEKNPKKDNKWEPYETRWEREHSEAAPALYFFENRQPDGVEGSVSDKRQDVSGSNSEISYPDGTTPGNLGWKDGMPFGTYIEVKGYYSNLGTARPGKGEITYRFMLGKDTKINYDCERNHHYRLTMRFNGYANDVDFHIDYREEAKPGFHVQDTTYVSYLYNQTSHTTIRATPREGYDLLSLEAHIVDNEWRPHDVADSEVDDMYNLSAWNNQINYVGNYGKSAGSYNRPTLKVTWKDFNGVSHTFEGANNIEFGFLSLRKTRDNLYELNGGNNGAFIAKMRKLFFDSDPNGSSTYNKNHSKGYRDYGTMPTTDESKEYIDDVDGGYTITRKTHPVNKSIDYVMEVPLYTRARSIDSWAVYSGANPFYRHHKYARVIFVAKYKKVDSSKPGPSEYQETGQTHVLQALRIDNPRGIYRRRTNKNSFNVVLCYNTKTATEQQDTEISDTEEIYEPIISRGGWTVSIEKDPHNLVQITANGRTIRGENSSITGRNNTPIAFTYTPIATPEDGDAYGATIFVTYHNNSCTHRVVVRQGYDAHEIGEGNTTLWSAFNVYDSKNLTKSPLSIGSTFRTLDDLSYPIKESNNTRKGYGVNKPIPGSLWIHGQDDTAWGSIPSMSSHPVKKDNISWQLHNSVHNKNYTYRPPDWEELPDIGIYTDKKYPAKDDAEVLKIGQAFGICYADGADGVLYTKGAYSYSDPENEGKDTKMGVRGVIVYSQENGDNVFFPFGSLGHPRRRRDGLLQYGSVNFKLTGATNEFRPMAYDLLHQVGGAYWITGSSTSNHVAIDYNGGNYMGSFLNTGDVYQTSNTSDALPIKPIIKDKTRITPPHLNNWFSVFYNIFSRFLPKAEILEGCFVHIYGGICLTMKKLLSCI